MTNSAIFIDDEVRLLSAKAYERVKKLLTEKMPEVKIIAEQLLEKEVLFKDDLERLIGKRPWDEHQVFEDIIQATIPDTIPPSPESTTPTV